MTDNEKLIKMRTLLNLNKKQFAYAMGVYVNFCGYIDCAKFNLSDKVKAKFEQATGQKFGKLMEFLSCDVTEKQLRMFILPVKMKPEIEKPNRCSKSSICWTCARCGNIYMGCPKSIKNKPVKGWEADKYKDQYQNHRLEGKTAYLVKKCPIYLKENKVEAWNRRDYETK